MSSSIVYVPVIRQKFVICNANFAAKVQFSEQKNKFFKKKLLQGTLQAKAVASIVQPIFAQGKLRARYGNAGIEQEKVRLQFEQTLLNAGNEVYRYLHICQRTEEKVQYLRVMVNALHEAYLGTKELMNNGTNTYLEVLKAQEDLLTAQLREVENHNDGVQALINLYIALGGAVE